MTSILHYVEHWLDLSAGFVHAQVSRSRHRAVVVSHNATENLDAFPVSPLWRLDRLHHLVPGRRWPALRTLALRAVATGYRCDIVHVHFGYVAGDVASFLRRTGLPLVVSLHGHDATALPRTSPRHYDDVVALADAVIVPSEFLRRVVTGIGFADDRVHVIPSGVDTAFFAPAPPQQEPVVTFVGRLVDKKGIDVLLDAWPAVRARVPQARLRVVGDGPLASLLPTDDPTVVHEGPTPRRRAEQVRHAVRAARVVVTPSRTAADGDSESLLLVNLEAQASGRPLVSTRHGGIPEFVEDAQSALLVAEGDAEALADALVAVLVDDALAARLGRHGPQVASRFDVAACAARVDDLYDDVLARRRGRK